IGHEETFAADVVDPDVLQRELLRLSTRTGERLRAAGIEARTVSIKVRWSDFETVTRSRTLPEATDATQRIYRTAAQLLADLGAAGRPVRLIGVRAEQLLEAGSEAAALWSDDDGWRAVDQAVDEVRGRFGPAGVGPASLLEGRGEVVDPRSLEAP
ncbi:MAG: DNA polymerase IV, partial [Leucobacter sp.]